mgnify:CR=1 FL=1
MQYILIQFNTAKKCYAIQNNAIQYNTIHYNIIQYITIKTKYTLAQTCFTVNFEHVLIVGEITRK